MTIDKAVMMFAGVVILTSLALAVFVNMNWLWLTAFVGANLVQAPLTGFCPAARFFDKLKIPCGATFCFCHNDRKDSCSCACESNNAASPKK